MEEEALEYIQKIDDLGGMLAAIDKGYPQMEIAEAAYHYQKLIDEGKKAIVGVNKYVTDHPPITIWKMDPEIERRQLKRLLEVKETRNTQKVREHLNELRGAAEGDKNLMPYIINAVREYATLQEICDVFREVFGTYTDPGMF
jgi:methylmalonyl-CoA mutase N-terminal domain/subunit